ncbi:MAG: ABC transporter substrate-binding protein [Ilumatobacteraceae bacterium]
MKSSRSLRTRTWISAAAVAGVLAVVAGACSPDKADTATTSSTASTTVASSAGTSSDSSVATSSTGSSVAPTTAAGGETPAGAETLTIATSFAIDDLDPIENSFWGPEFGYVELLMRPERDGNPSPWVLKDLKAENDTTWTLTLRDNVVFENGKKFDVQALVDLLEYSEEKNESFATAAKIASVTASGADTVTVTTTEPVPGMPNILADEANVPVYDVPAYKEHLASGADPSALLAAGLYTGPYQVTSLSEQSVSLEPVANYWDGTPALSALTIKIVPETTSRVQAVQAGEADIAIYMPTVVATTLEGRNDAFYVTGQPTGSTFALQLRNAGPFVDTNVRKAVLAAIDYRSLAEDVLDGRAAVAESVFGPSFPFAVKTQVTDLDDAKRLLDEAGWVADGGGTRAKDGQSLTLRLLSYPQQPDSDTLAVALQAQLKEVGIAVEVSNVPDITASRKGDDWDAAIVGDSLMSFALSPEVGLRSGLVTGGDQNFMKVSNAELDALVDKLSTTLDKTERNDLLVQIQQVIHDNGLWAALVMRQPAVVTNAKWKGYTTPLANMWVDAKTAPTA